MSDLTPTPDASVGVLEPPMTVAAPAVAADEGAPTAWPPGPRRGWPARFVRGKESDPAEAAAAREYLAGANAVRHYRLLA